MRARCAYYVFVEINANNICNLTRDPQCRRSRMNIRAFGLEVIVSCTICEFFAFGRIAKYPIGTWNRSLLSSHSILIVQSKPKIYFFLICDVIAINVCGFLEQNKSNLIPALYLNIIVMLTVPRQ